MTCFLSTVNVSGRGESLPANPDGHTAELYKPPYFFTGIARPAIAFAPTLVSYGQQVNATLTATVNGVTAAQIEKVSLIRPGSPTHWFDSDQRFVKLTSSVSGTYTLNVTAPADGNIAPPGYYMLFVVSDMGVPSVAAWVRVDDPV